MQRIALYATRLPRAASLSAEYMKDAMKPSITDVDLAPSLFDHVAYAATGEMPQKSGRLSALREAVGGLPAEIAKLADGQLSPELAAALDRFPAAVEALPGAKKTPLDALRIVETLESRFQRYETQLENRLCSVRCSRTGSRESR